MIDIKKIRIALLEEEPSVRSKNILADLCDRFTITYVTAAREMPPAKYARVCQVPSPKFVLHRSWEISALADSLYKEGTIDFAVSWARIGLFTRHVPVLLSVGGSYAHEVRIIWHYYPWSKRWRAATGYFHYAIPEIVSARRATMISVPSEAMRQRMSLSCGVPAQKIRLVPEGVGALFFDSYDEQKFSVDPKIAFVGRTHPGKGIRRFVEQFVRSRIDAPLLIAGDGPELDDLLRLAARDRRLQVLGKLAPTKVAGLLRETSVFVWPSLYEGCPIAVLEAMASGHACVAYPEGSSAEVLEDSALYAKFNDPVDLCARLGELLQDRNRIRSLARMARQRATQFHWQNCLAKTEELFLDFYRELHPNGSIPEKRESRNALGQAGP